jgi:hypothetical protein
MAAGLLVGPVLRRVVDTRATVWVETDGPATVTVRAEGGGQGVARTFSAYGHHYALVIVEDLRPGAASRYTVEIDGSRAWPEPGYAYPPPVIRTRPADDAAEPVRVVFGSCRETTQHATTRRLPPDALDAYARRMMDDDSTRPDVLLLLGDQVYADVVSPKVRRILKKRRKPGRGRPHLDRPADQVVTFDEYTKLYFESWRDPEIRWMMATVPSVMIFDDHEIIDDWNTSASWREAAQRKPWWAERIANGLASYWVYQHLGNLHPDEIPADPVYSAVVAAGDGTEVLREFAARVDKESDVAHDTERWRAAQYQWSYALDIAGVRLVVLDNRCSRVLDPSDRAMLPPGEWGWFTDQATGDYDHLVVASSLPWLLPPGIHHLEAWSERYIATARPARAAAAEKIRRAVDLEHWAAFRRSFEDMGALFARIGSGRRRDGDDRVGAGPAYAAPASINVLSGDVHHSYVARVHFEGVDVLTPVHQLTCSPVHNQVPAVARPLMSLGWWRFPSSLTRALARSAGVPRSVVRWRKLAGPYYGNAISSLDLRGREAEITIEGTTRDGDLRRVARLPLVPAPRRPAAPAGLAATGSSS